MGIYTSTGALKVLSGDTSGRGLYAPDGSVRITVVPGTSYTGRYAADGSLNVVNEAGPLIHPCGALRGQTSLLTYTGLSSPSGALYMDGLVSDGPPVNLAIPTITGTTTIGSTLTSSTGTWSGTSPITYAYQWKRAGSNISGATSSTYTLVSADLNQNITVTVTATNVNGSASATSVAVIPVDLSPAGLFAAGEQGVWYDPSDTSTMFQSSSSGLPVTADGDPVGLILDKSKGLALGTETVVNGTFANTSTWLTSNSSFSVVSDRAFVTHTAGTTGSIYQFLTTVTGKTYRFTVDYERGTATEVFISISSGGTFTSTSSSGTFNVIFTATATTHLISIGINGATTGGTAYFDNASFRDIAGNHAFQATATSRPTYRLDGTRGYLDFDGGDLLMTSSNTNDYLNPALMATPGSELILNGDFSTTSDWTLGTGWSITGGVASFTSAAVAASITQPVTLTAGKVYAITFTATRSAGTLTPRFTGGTNVSGTAITSSGTFTQYLISQTGNTTLDFLASISFAGTIDNVSVRETSYYNGQIFAGMQKDVDTATAVVIEHGPSTSGNNPGTIGHTSSRAGGANISFGSRPLVVGITRDAVTYTAPIKLVTYGGFDTSQSTVSDTISVLVNNTTPTLTDAGTQVAHALIPSRIFVGARGVTVAGNIGTVTSYLDGRIYGVVLRFGPPLNSTTISNINDWMNTKTGAY